MLVQSTTLEGEAACKVSSSAAGSLPSPQHKYIPQQEQSTKKETSCRSCLLDHHAPLTARLSLCRLSMR